MIIITGATGELGGQIVQGLLEKVPSSQIGVSVRDPAKAGALEKRGVRVRRGDFADPQSLQRAFEGASQVLLISSNSSGAHAIEHHRNAIEAAKAAGAARILYTSHMGASPSSRFRPMVDHAATEAVLESCGVPFTSLRNGYYASSAIQILGKFRETGQITVPADGAVSWTAHPDLAQAAILALTQEEQGQGQLDGISAPLTALQSLTFADVAAIASELVGREIALVRVSNEDYRASMAARGVPAARLDILMGMFAAIGAGEFAAVDPTLERLIGHAPISMRAVLAGHLANS